MNRIRQKRRPRVEVERSAFRQLRLSRLEKVKGRLESGFYDDPSIDEEVGRVLARLFES